MKQKEFKESVKALKSCIYLIEHYSYSAYKFGNEISSVYKMKDEDRIADIRSNIDSMLIILKDIKINLDENVLRYIRK